MKNIHFSTIIIQSILFFTPAFVSAQNSGEQSDFVLLGLTENHIDESSMLSDEQSDRQGMHEEVEEAFRIDLLSDKLVLDTSERSELFDLQTAELQLELTQYLDSQLVYPSEMKEYHIEGTVIVEVAITKHGELLSPRIYKGLNPSCDQASLKALEGFQYQRGMYKGAKRILIPIAFIIE